MTDSNRPVFSDTDTPMDVLVKLSQHFGNDPDFIVAGGGNTSVKDDTTLWVKASGFSLATIGPEGFVEMERSKLDDLLASDLGSDVDQREEKYKNGVMTARKDPDSGLRPSVECVLHNLMPSKYVVHTHPAHGNAITCTNGGKQLAEELFGEDMIWIDYIDPGYTLARKIYDELKAWQKSTGLSVPEAIFMENHGLVIAGDTPQEIYERTDKIISPILNKINSAPADNVFGQIEKLDEQTAPQLKAKIEQAIKKALPEKELVFDDSDMVMQLAGGANGKSIAAVGPLCPDQIVYCKSFPLWLDVSVDSDDLDAVVADAIKTHKEQTGFDPYVILVSKLGMFTAESSLKSAQTACEMYRSIIETMSYAQRLGGIQAMDTASRKFIEDWEVESYRKKVADA